jgi:hypothetical protein
MERRDRLSSKASKFITKAKSTSNITTASNCLYKSFLSSKSNNSADCIVVEKPHANGRGALSSPKFEEEERAYGNGVGAKRAHLEVCGPRIDNARSPSSNEEANPDASGNGFVTARAKLVFILLPDNAVPDMSIVVKSSLQKGGSLFEYAYKQNFFTRVSTVLYKYCVCMMLLVNAVGLSSYSEVETSL